MSEERRRRHLVGVRLDDDELMRIRRIAAWHGSTEADVLRFAAHERISTLYGRIGGLTKKVRELERELAALRAMRP